MVVTWSQVVGTESGQDAQSLRPSGKVSLPSRFITGRGLPVRTRSGCFSRQGHCRSRSIIPEARVAIEKGQKGSNISGRPCRSPGSFLAGASVAGGSAASAGETSDGQDPFEGVVPVPDSAPDWDSAAGGPACLTPVVAVSGGTSPCRTGWSSFRGTISGADLLLS